jgi:hypothetical protein
MKAVYMVKNLKKETVCILVRKGTIPTERPPLAAKYCFTDSACCVFNSANPIGH